jgi:acyl-CoA thioesterase FadM
MTANPVNRDLLPGSTCFGCGPDNPHGLHVEIARDDDDPDRLIGTFTPQGHMTGFPGITHGGAIYTALDCMAAWTPMVLRRQTKALWILRSAAITYHRPAHQGRPLLLASWIEEEGGDWEPLTVHSEARGEDGRLLTEGSFKVIPLQPDRFRKIAGIDRLPDNWSALLGDGAP